MSTLRTVLLGIMVTLALGAFTTAQAAVSYNAILEWTGPYYRVINNPGVDQMVDKPVIDMAFVQPYAVAAREHGANQRDVVYVVDSGHNRVQAFEANGLYITDTPAYTSPLTGANQFDATTIRPSIWVTPAATRWVLPHSEVVVIDGVQWTWVAALGTFTAADKVYTIDYTATGAAPVVTLPAGSLSSTSVVRVSYAYTDYKGGGTAADGLGDVDYGTSNGAAPF